MPQFQGGIDGWADITPDDFFDPTWTVDSEDPGQGVTSLAQLSDLTMLAVSDLYSPAPLVPLLGILDPPSLAGPDFATCVDLPVQTPQGTGSYNLTGLRLDPLDPSDRATITSLQLQVVQYAEQVGQFVALLDVPPGLTQRLILNWRAAFNSTYAACYHPWLQISVRNGNENDLVLIPPSAPAAGIIAATAIQYGVPTGPANVIAAQVVDVADVVSPARHDQLHPLGINVYLRDRDGVRLTAARTLSRDPQYRQLTVRRLMTLLKLTLDQQMQWAVFEPNNAGLRLEVRLLLTTFLRGLFLQGAFSGGERSRVVLCALRRHQQPALHYRRRENDRRDRRRALRAHRVHRGASFAQRGRHAFHPGLTNMADTLLRSFRFKIQLKVSAPGGHNGSDIPTGTPLGDGAFQECSGLELDLDVQEYYEGGRNNAVVRRVGRAKFQNIVLKRGMFYGDSGSVNQDLWLWLQGIASDERPVTRYDGTIFVMSVGDTVAATWTFDRGLPAKLRGPELNAKTGEVAIEELTIAHEGLRLVNT